MGPGHKKKGFSWNTVIFKMRLCESIIHFFLSFLFFKLLKYDNTFTGDLRNTERVTYRSSIYYNFLSK